ncbi:hypothetical protein C7M84_000539 [Penaeus vannamei]|uniref:Uncharacterized protein n=1 Tax=Penaeus vannamei TaxID=6689 RepID=A0A423TWA4_PENVA|nr:hypothetical protein C7M84_000539 [Penaeus vannamei]
MASCPPCVRSNKDKHLRNLHIACIAADTLLAQLPALSMKVAVRSPRGGAVDRGRVAVPTTPCESSTFCYLLVLQSAELAFYLILHVVGGRLGAVQPDLYEDLYDDDAHDRAQARAALTRLRASGAITGNSFRNNRFIPNRGFGNNNGFRTSGFNSNGFRTSRFNNNGFSNRFPSNSRSTGFNSNNRFGTNNRVSSFNNNNRFASNPDRASSFNSNLANRFPTNTNSHFRGPNTANSGFGRPLSSSNPFTTKRSSGSSFSSSESLNAIPGSSDFKSASTSSSPFKSFNSNINRLGGNGYFFSMKTHGAEPVTYFIRYDD